MELRFVAVGHCTHTTARMLAVFSDLDRRAVDVAWRRRGADAWTSRSFDVRDADPFGRVEIVLDELPAAAAIEYRITPGRDSRPYEGSFRLLPNDRAPRIAIVSCNKIKNAKIQRQRRGLLWRELGRCVAREEVDLIVHMGDQIYADDPPEGIADKSPPILQYRQHYVDTWSHCDVRSVLAACPSIMMWDDHEIWDGYGSNKRDFTNKAQRRFAAARTAFDEFQMALAPPRLQGTSFAWKLEGAGIAILAPDGRQHRDWWRKRILGEEQLGAIGTALDELATRSTKPKHLFFVLGTPPYYLKTWVVNALGIFPGFGDNLRDGWTARNNSAELDAMLHALADFSTRSGVAVTILGGDVHVSTIGVITVDRGSHSCKINQITSSGIGRSAAGTMEEWLLATAMNKGKPKQVVNGKIHASLRRIDDERSPYVITDRNFAVIETKADGRLDITYVRERGGEAERAFDEDPSADESLLVERLAVSLDEEAATVSGSELK